MRSAILLLALMACSPAAPETPAPVASASGSTTAPPQRQLQGTYIVTFVNEAEPLIGIEGHEPTVTISADRIHFQSQCIYHDWSFLREGEELEIGPWDYGEQVAAMCARGLAPGEEAIIAAIGGADTVRFVPHGIWMDGEGGTVQMRFVPSEADLASRAVDLTGEWRVAGIDGEALDAAYGIALSADWNGVWWEPGCAGQGVSYTIDGARFDAPEPGNPGMVCDIGFPDELPVIWSALAAADTIERTPENGVRIHGNGRSVTLFSQ